MMRTSRLVFSLQSSLYAVEAHVVREILWLPELTPIEEAPAYIVGVFNFRGKIVPVMDLHIRFGHASQRYRLTDRVIVLEHAGLLMGIIVNDVHDVRSISTEEIEAVTTYGQEGETRSRFIASVAKVEEDLIMLLHLENLMRLPEGIEEMSEEGKIPPPLEERSFCPEAASEEKAIFRERARNMMRPIENQDLTGGTPLAVIGLSGECFGIALDIVREFVDIPHVTPVPCCPEHIVGVTNLRGDLLTLVDIRRALKMPFGGKRAPGKGVVVQIDDLCAGVMADEVLEVIYLQPTNIIPVPEAVQSLNEEFLKGTAPYGGKMLSILDLPKILTQGDLVVNEEA